MPGPPFTIYDCTPQEHINSYRWSGVLMAILGPVLWVSLDLDQRQGPVPWWMFILLIPAFFAVSWFVTENTWSLDANVQRQARRQFILYFWRTFLFTTVAAVLLELTYWWLKYLQAT